MNTAPGWYPDDPHRPEHRRWWDGERWTEHANDQQQPVSSTDVGVHPGAAGDGGGQVLVPPAVLRDAPGGVLGAK